MNAKNIIEQLLAEREMITAAETFAEEHASHVRLQYTILCDEHGGVGLHDNLEKAVDEWNTATSVAERDGLPCLYRIIPIVTNR